MFQVTLSNCQSPAGAKLETKQFLFPLATWTHLELMSPLARFSRRSLPEEWQQKQGVEKSCRFHTQATSDLPWNTPYSGYQMADTQQTALGRTLDCCPGMPFCCGILLRAVTIWSMSSTWPLDTGLTLQRTKADGGKTPLTTRPKKLTCEDSNGLPPVGIGQTNQLGGSPPSSSVL